MSKRNGIAEIVRAISTSICNAVAPQQPRELDSKKVSVACSSPTTVVSNLEENAPEKRVLLAYAAVVRTRVFDASFKTGHRVIAGISSPFPVGLHQVSGMMMAAPASDGWNIAVGACMLLRRVTNRFDRVDSVDARIVLVACLLIAAKANRGEAFRGLSSTGYWRVVEGTVYNVVFEANVHLSEWERDLALMTHRLRLTEGEIMSRYAAVLFPVLLATPAARVENLAHESLGGGDLTTAQERAVVSIRNVASRVVQALLVARAEGVLVAFEAREQAHAAAVALFTYSVAVLMLNDGDVVVPELLQECARAWMTPFVGTIASAMVANHPSVVVMTDDDFGVLLTVDLLRSVESVLSQ